MTHIMPDSLRAYKQAKEEQVNHLHILQKIPEVTPSFRLHWF